MPQKVKQFIEAAEAIGIEVSISFNWDEKGGIAIWFMNVQDCEDNDIGIIVNSDGVLIT